MEGLQTNLIFEKFCMAEKIILVDKKFSTVSQTLNAFIYKVVLTVLCAVSAF